MIKQYLAHRRLFRMFVVLSGVFWCITGWSFMHYYRQSVDLECELLETLPPGGVVKPGEFWEVHFRVKSPFGVTLNAVNVSEDTIIVLDKAEHQEVNNAVDGLKVAVRLLPLRSKRYEKILLTFSFYDLFGREFTHEITCELPALICGASLVSGEGM